MKEREPQASTLRIKRILAKLKENKAFALAIVGTSVALAGCGNKTNSNEASTTNREKPVATETQQKASPVEVKHQSNADLVAEFKNRDGGIGGYPLKCGISNEDSEYTFSVTNTKSEDVGVFELDLNIQNKYEATDANGSWEPYTPIAGLESGGLDASWDESAGQTVLYVPGLGAGDTITLKARLPKAQLLSMGVSPRFPGSEDSSAAYYKMSSGYNYQVGKGGQPWKPEIHR
jgi:hypothetical protein